MRFIVHVSRVLVGLLFILSGLLKLNDPIGFSYKLEEYFGVFAEDVKVQQDSFLTSITYSGNSKEFKNALQVGDSILQFIVKPSMALVDSTDTSSIRYQQTFQLLHNGQVVHTGEVTYRDSSFPNLKISGVVGSKSLLDETITLNPKSTDSYLLTANVSDYILPQGSLPKLFDFGRQHAMFFSIFISCLEAILGFALILGWQAGFTVSFMFLLTLGFTFLTWYSWIFDKVTDCGCFGDALPMSPKASFFKNIVLLLFILILLFGRKYIKPIFSNPFGVKVLTIIIIFLVGFSLYCKHYLPVVDFLHFKEGNDIRELMVLPKDARSSPHVIIRYRYKAKDGSGASQEVVYDTDLQTFTPIVDKEKWAYDTILDEKILELASKPAIHDFMMLGNDHATNYLDSFWKQDKKMLIVFKDVESCNQKSIQDLRKIAEHCNTEGIPVWALTASPADVTEAFRHEHQISEFDFYYGDGTQIKSIIRSNPGLLLFKDTSVVCKQWPATRLPDIKELDKSLK